jgi:hypothetical protein
MKKIFLTALLITASYAVPAFKGDITFTQADGGNFKGTVEGDEWFHWVQDKHGNAIKYNNKSKNYEYGKVVENQGALDLKPSGTKVATGLNSMTEDISIIDPKILSKIWKQKREKATEKMNPKRTCPTKQTP